jgi:glycosyltransferase involved in cell wall biosynthesis
MHRKAHTCSHLTESLGGGVLTAIKAIADAQNRIGQSTELVYLERIDTPSFIQIEALFPNSRIVNLGTSNLMGKIRLLIYSIKVLFTWEPGQIIHVHSTIAGAITRIPNLLFRRRIYYTPHCYAFLRQDIGLLEKEIYRFIEKTLSRLTPTIVLGCSYAETEIARKIGAKEYRYLGNYVEVQENQDLSTNQARNSKIIIGTVGRITRQKNLPRYIQLLQNLEFPVLFHWIGGSESTKVEIKEGKYINFSGWLTPEVAKEELKKLDIFLLLSDWEGLPFVALEAMALGKPVILWNFDASSQLVPTGTEGYVVDSIESALIALSELISSPEKRSQMGKAGKALVQSNFNLSLLPKIVSTIYDSPARVK